MDPRYPYHSNLHFSGYNNNRYRIHVQGKNNTNYYPQSMLKYQINQWNKYINNIYLIYLINKRYHQYFPGKPYFRINY